MSNQKPQSTIVQLRVYRSNGRDNRINYNADGSVQNENHFVTLKYNTMSWFNYLTHLKNNGFVKVDVEKVIENGKEVINMATFKKEVQDAFFNMEEKTQTPKQKRIAELEAKIAQLINIVASGVNKTDKDPALVEARARYLVLFGKKGSPSWTVEEINAKIADEEARIADEEARIADERQNGEE